MNGLVSLVGAGPGDPELLTVRGARALAEADLVLYDALVSPEALALAPHAQRFCVGKRAGRPSMRQQTINSLMIRAARRGKRVVRLKGGDPFVFGRGGEEALALAAAGVPFEVVPGVSSAIAAAGLSGIPVTHRGIATALLVVSGHDPAAWRPVLAPLTPRSLTIVVLMGLASRGAIAAELLARGWPAGTPAAVLWAAGTSKAQRWLGTLERLGDATPAEATGAPATLVIGAVVALANVLASRLDDDLNVAPAVAEERGDARARAR